MHKASPGFLNGRQFLVRLSEPGQNRVIEEVKKESTISQLEDEIHLWLFDLANIDLSGSHSILSATEEEQFSNIKIDEVRRSRTLSRTILRSLLSEYVHIPGALIEFEYNDLGKPSIDSNQEPHVHFNLSHTEQWVAVAISQFHSIGVDLEINQRKDIVIDRLMKRFFHENEKQIVDQLSEKEKSVIFNKAWTIKEAMVKALGKGVYSIKQMPDLSPVLPSLTSSTESTFHLDPFTGGSFNLGDLSVGLVIVSS